MTHNRDSDSVLIRERIISTYLPIFIMRLISRDKILGLRDSVMLSYFQQVYFKKFLNHNFLSDMRLIIINRFGKQPYPVTTIPT